MKTLKVVRFRLSAVAPVLALLSTTVLHAGPTEDQIERLVSSLDRGETRITQGTELDTAQLIPEFYELRNYAAAWFGTRNLEQLFAELNKGVEQGFLPEDFNLPVLYELFELAKSGDPENIALFELVASDAAVKLVHHIVFGKVDASKLDGDWNFSRPIIQQEPAEALNRFLDGEGFSALMDRVDLDAAQYLQLVDALKKYRAIRNKGGWPIVPDDTTLKPGMSSPAVAELRRRLNAEAVAGESVVSDGSPQDQIYDEPLVKAVKHFQERHGLEADGVVGPASFRSLNRRASERVDQLRLSLERGRWLMRDLEDEFVLVNIAGARTYYVKPGTIWTTRSITGSAYRKTPVFRDNIRYLEFNPTWTVPVSIFRNDKLPRIRKDPSYLSRNNYVVVNSQDRTPIKASSVNWQAKNPGVTLVQQPGPDNALGRVKFMFPNEHAVYLHDTNERGLFDRNERNLSSGCVRLEYPFEFASLLLEGLPEGSAEGMKKILDSGRTTRVDLDRPVPVLLTYWTAWVEEGDVHFREDPYERDAAILEALNSN